MASTPEYLEYVLDLLACVPEVTTRKMMGEYLLYASGKLFGGIYDDRFLVKDTKASREIVPKSQYDRHGAFVIQSCGNASYYFALFARVEKDGTEVYSAGVGCVSAGMQAKRRISYRFRKRRKWLLLGPVEGIDLVIKSPGPFPLPNLTIMKKRSAQPLGRFDGEHVATITDVRERRTVVPLPVSPTDSGFYLKLFADDEARETSIAFNPPPFPKTRI